MTDKTTPAANPAHTVEYHAMRRRLDALQAACKLPRPRCIGMLEAEFEEKARRQMEALEVLFQEVVNGEAKP